MKNSFSPCNSLLILAILLFSGCEPTKEKNNQQYTTFSRIDEYMMALTQLEGFNGVVLIQNSAGEVFEKAYQFDSLYFPSMEVKLSSQFDIRSVAKLFAKAALARSFEKGLIQPNSTIDQFYPQLAKADQITIQHLMDHTAGFSRELAQIENTADKSPEEIITLIHEQALEYEPGTDTLYSNLGFQLLYDILGKINNTTFALAMREQFFDPFHMERSGSHYGDPEAKLTDYAYGHFNENDSMKAILMQEKDNMQAGHLFSTTSDLNTFLNELKEKNIYHTIAKDSIISHAGGTRGKRAWVYTDLRKNYNLVFLANFDGIPFQQLTEDLIKIMEGEKVSLPEKVNRTAITLNSKLLRTYEGTYDFVDAGHIILTIRLESDTLRVYQKGEFAGNLLPENDTTFFHDPSSKESFVFVKDSDSSNAVLMDFQGVQWKGIPIQE